MAQCECGAYKSLGNRIHLRDRTGFPHTRGTLLSPFSARPVTPRDTRRYPLTPAFLRNAIIGHQPLNADWNRFSPTNSDQDQVLLAEAERGESVATRAYKKALTGMLPPTASDLVAQQYAGICDAHARITALAKARDVIV